MTMSFLGASQVAGIRASTSGVFWDSCTILRYTAPASEGGYGQYDGTWGDYDDDHPELEIATPCKVGGLGLADDLAWSEEVRGRGSITFPVTLEGQVGRLDRVQITSKFGSTLAASITCVVNGDPVMGLLGIRCDVEVVP
jgi:hypothetical protein